jgi:hypothetical protein
MNEDKINLIKKEQIEFGQRSAYLRSTKVTPTLKLTVNQNNY